MGAGWVGGGGGSARAGGGGGVFPLLQCRRFAIVLEQEQYVRDLPLFGAGYRQTDRRTMASRKRLLLWTPPLSRGRPAVFLSLLTTVVVCTLQQPRF